MDASTPGVGLSTLSDQPTYNVKAVCRRTGLSATTLRAWERRYGLPVPYRTPQGYRLYSERDIAILGWLREQTESGITISQATHNLKRNLESNEEVSINIVSAATESSGLRSPDMLRDELAIAFLHMDNQRAENTITEAQALYTPDTLTIHILRGALAIVYDRCRDDHLPLTIDHFAFNYVRQHLLSLIQTLTTARTRRRAIIIGFPDEHTEIDLLLLNLLLRRQGIPVANLGADLDPLLLLPALSTIQAGVVIFYVDTPQNAARLIGLPMPTAAGDDQVWVCCGHALEADFDLRHRILLDYLGSDIRVIVKDITKHLSENMPQDRPPMDSLTNNHPH